MLRGRGGDGDRGCGDGYSVHGDGRGWVSVSVPVQTSSMVFTVRLSLCLSRCVIISIQTDTR